MTRKAKSPAPPARDPDNLLLFTPVPLRRNSATGWNPATQIAFIAMLSRNGVVAASARSVGRTPRSAYQLRQRAGAESFAAAWDWALEIGLDTALGEAMKQVQAAHAAEEKGDSVFVGDYSVMMAALRALGNQLQIGRDMEHRHRIADRDMIAANDARFGGPLDWDAIDMPWFDRSAIPRGPHAVAAACIDARAIEAELALLRAARGPLDAAVAMADAALTEKARPVENIGSAKKAGTAKPRTPRPPHAPAPACPLPRISLL